MYSAASVVGRHGDGQGALRAENGQLRATSTCCIHVAWATFGWTPASRRRSGHHAPHFRRQHNGQPSRSFLQLRLVAALAWEFSARDEAVATAMGLFGAAPMTSYPKRLVAPCRTSLLTMSYGHIRKRESRSAEATSGVSDEHHSLRSSLRGCTWGLDCLAVERRDFGL
jgi:hypothetical protein